MMLAARAWKLREAARQALEAGDFEATQALAAGSHAAQATSAANSLRLLGAWLEQPPRSIRAV
jgi:hypothetical protein